MMQSPCVMDDLFNSERGVRTNPSRGDGPVPWRHRLSGGSSLANQSFSGPRMQREAVTIRAMIGMYCRDHHDTQDALCAECAALSDYAMERLRRCPYPGRQDHLRQVPHPLL